MSLFNFLYQLWNSGRVEVSAHKDALGSEERKVRTFLRGLSQEREPDLPFKAPPLNDDAALWAALKLYRGAQFMVFLDADEALIRSELGEACPSHDSPTSLAYSVDLSFQFLGDLLFLAQKNKDRPFLVDALRTLAARWPLSSVGIPDTAPSSALEFLENPCLKQLYVDRIIARSDASRLTSPKVRDAVKAALGMYPELCPGLALALNLDPKHPSKE